MATPHQRESSICLPKTPERLLRGGRRREHLDARRRGEACPPQLRGSREGVGRREHDGQGRALRRSQQERDEQTENPAERRGPRRPHPDAQARGRTRAHGPGALSLVREPAPPHDPTKPAKKWDGAWRSLRDAAGLRGFRFHDLRHTVVTDLLEAGEPEHVIQAGCRVCDGERRPGRRPPRVGGAAPANPAIGARSSRFAIDVPFNHLAAPQDAESRWFVSGAGRDYLPTVLSAAAWMYASRSSSSRSRA
jgi:hypothetical protein